MKGLAWLNGAPVEVAGAEDEGARPVGESAGSLAWGGGLEDTGIGAGFADLTLIRAWAVRHACDAAEDDSEGAAEDISRFARREEE